MHSRSMHTVREVSLTETPGQRPPWTETSWKETLLDRDPPRQRPPGRNMRPSTETPFPEGKWDQAARQEGDIMQRRPPGQND